jgi:hypothetical protein
MSRCFSFLKKKIIGDFGPRLWLSWHEVNILGFVRLSLLRKVKCLFLNACNLMNANLFSKFVHDTPCSCHSRARTTSSICGCDIQPSWPVDFTEKRRSSQFWISILGIDKKLHEDKCGSIVKCIIQYYQYRIIIT